MSNTQQTWSLTEKFGMAFVRGASKEAQQIYQKLKQTGLSCEQDTHHNGTYFIEVDPRMICGGLPISAEFIGAVKAAGGRFCGPPVASMFNNPRLGIGMAKTTP